jgi:hypothetical protein
MSFYFVISIKETKNYLCFTDGESMIHKDTIVFGGLAISLGRN